MSQSHPDDHLAYGQYHPQDPNQPRTGESTRGLVEGTFKKLRETYKSHHPPSHPQHPGQSQSYTPEGGLVRTLLYLQIIISIILSIYPDRRPD